MSGWDRLHRVTAPDGDILSLDDAKEHLRVDDDDQDATILRNLRAAQAAIEGPHGVGLALLTQTWRMTLDCWPWTIEIPLLPVSAVTGITYVAMDGSTQTLSPSAYIVDLEAEPVSITRAFGVAWPSPRLQKAAIKVTFTAGFGDDPDTVPEDIKQAMLLLTGHFYEHREAVVGVDARDSSTELPLGVSATLDRYRAGCVA